MLDIFVQWSSLVRPCIGSIGVVRLIPCALLPYKKCSSFPVYTLKCSQSVHEFVPIDCKFATFMAIYLFSSLQYNSSLFLRK
jgi:hypothetical protein